ncbi:MAG: D-alanyl-D-alanine carboxypeptidase [Patescibacteria group bacterium]
MFLHTLILIENLGRVPDITFTLSVRMCLYFVVIVTAFTAFSLPAYKHSALLNPSFIESSPLASAVLADSKVLGASTSSVKPFPEVSATSVYVFDLAANTSIYEKNSTLSLPPASTTKLITALVSLDLYNLDDSLAVPTECTQVAGQRVGFLSKKC